MKGIALRENSSRHHHVAAPALRSRTDVSAFALAAYCGSPDGISIDNCQVPGLHRVEVQRSVSWSPGYNYKALILLILLAGSY